MSLTYDILHENILQIINNYYLNHDNDDNHETLFSDCPSAEKNKDLINFQELLKNVRISNKEKIKLYLCAVLSDKNNPGFSDIEENFHIIEGWINYQIPTTEDPILKKLLENYDKDSNLNNSKIHNSKLIYFIQNCIL